LTGILRKIEMHANNTLFLIHGFAFPLNTGLDDF